MFTLLKKIITELNLWNKFVFALNLVAVIALLISYLAPFVSPHQTVLIAYFGLAFPVIASLNILFVLYWIILRKGVFLVSTIALMLGLLSFSRFFQITLFSSTPSSDKCISVMSFNVRLFDLYNWSGNKESKDKIMEFIKSESPDVVCFQEYYKGVDVHFAVNSFMKDSVGYKYLFEHFTTSAKEHKGSGNNFFGSAIYSKYPIINADFVEFDNDVNNHISYVDILKDNDTLRIVNAHIGSMRLQNADYQLIGGDDNKKWAHEKQEKQDIFTRITKAFYRRADQIEVLKDLVKHSTPPVVVCVDLNDTPNSYAYEQVVELLDDAFIFSGNGIGSTYVGDNFFNKIMPLNRIDYIFHSKELTSLEFITHQEKLSDHKAISCVIYF